MIKAGTGIAALDLTPVLPIEGFNVIQNDLHVRTIILDGKKRMVIVSVEVTSLQEDSVVRFLGKIKEMTGADDDCIWMTFTHSFAGPHVFLPPKPGQHRPGPEKSPEELQKGLLLEKAYFRALEESIEAALGSFKDAVIGAGEGRSFVNTSRNVLTDSGWATGSDDDLACDRTLKVLRIDSPCGEPIALIYNYGIRSNVMSRCRNEKNEEIISCDLCGVTCTQLEKEFGDGFVAVFLCAASTDSEPRYKSTVTSAGHDGAEKTVRYDYRDCEVMLRAQAAQLSSDIIKVYRKTETAEYDGDFRCAARETVCERKKANPSGEVRDNTDTGEWESDGTETLTVYAAALGPVTLAGVQPEIDSLTAIELAKAGGSGMVMPVIMVNGSGKALPARQAYDLRQFPGIHSPYMPGTAEKLAETADKLIRDLRSGISG